LDRQAWLDVGDWLQEKVRRAVEEADVYLLLCADGVFHHAWVRFELAHAVRAGKPILLMVDPLQSFNTKPVQLLADVPQGYHELLEEMVRDHVWMRYERTGSTHKEMLRRLADFLQAPNSVSELDLRKKLQVMMDGPKHSWKELEKTPAWPELLSGELKLFDVNFDTATIVSEKSREFEKGTREWFFERLRISLSSGSGRAFVLHGGAGVGKSCVAAEIAKRAGFLSKRKSIAEVVRNSLTKVARLPVDAVAVHFFRSDDNFLSDARFALFSMSNQLARRLPGYGIAVGNPSEIRWDEMELSTVFRLLIIDPCMKVEPSGQRPQLIIIDALDECAIDQRSAFIDMLRIGWPQTPPWLRLVVTTRPEARIPEMLRGFEQEKITADDPLNTEDLEICLRRKLEPGMQPKDLGRAVERLLVQSDGLFLFVRFVDHTLKELQGPISASDLNMLFPGETESVSALDAVYLRYFRRLRDKILKGSEEVYVTMLGPVVAARAALPVRIAFQIFRNDNPNLKLAGFKRLIRDSQLLTISQGVVRFIHVSTMRAWLEKEVLEVTDDYDGLRSAGDHLLADVLKKNEDVFAFDHCVFHQVEIGVGLQDTAEKSGVAG